MEPLLITTKVDLSGVNQLAAGVESAMSRVVSAQLRAKAEVSALKEAYSTLGPSAQQGNAQAISAIAEHEAAVRASTNEVNAAKAAVAALEHQEDEETGALLRNISARQAATATISLAEGHILGANRAAAAFLSTTLGLGPVLQAAFPIIGIAAFSVALYEIGKNAYSLYQNIVNLKSEIDALGEASSKTAREAASANWEWVQSYVELLKAQGKFADAKVAESAHAGEKPERLSLGLSKDQLKELPQAMQDFAKSLEQVNTAGQASAVFKELDKQIDETAKKIQDLQDKITHPKTVSIATYGVPTQVPEDTSRYSAQLTAATEYENSLKNLRQANASTQSAEQNKAARENISLAKESASQQAGVLKQQEEAAVASYEKQKAANHVLYEQGIISAQQWAAVAAKADSDVAAAHEQYYAKAAALFRAAGEAQKASALGSDEKKSTDTDEAKNLEQLAEGYKTLNKTLEEYRAEIVKDVANSKEDETQLKAASQAIVERITANRALIESERQLGDAFKQYDYSQRANQIAIAGAREYSSESSTRTQLQALYKQEHDDAVSEIQERANDQLDVIRRTQAEIARISSVTGGANDEQAARGVRLTQLQAELAQEQAAYDQSNSQILAKDQQFNQQMTALKVAELKEELKAINDFVSQGTSALNNFLVTIATTKGRGNEFRFLAEEWQKLLFGMEKDFLNFILRTFEETDQFKTIVGGLRNALSGVLSKIGLGPAASSPASTGAAAAGAAQATASSLDKSTDATSMLAFNAALKPATLALTQMAAAAHAATAAEASEAPATQAVTAAKISEAPVTTASVAAKSAEIPATTAVTTAQAAQVPAVAASTTAHAVHVPSVLASTLAHLEHAPAVAADTIALIAHKIATLFTSFDEGGYVPRTGMAIIHAGERVATPDMWREIGEMGEKGEDGEDAEDAGRGGHVFHIHHNMNVSAIDPKGFDGVMKRHSGSMSKQIMHQIKRGSLRLPR
jgi:hypothetical protein